MSKRIRALQYVFRTLGTPATALRGLPCNDRGDRIDPHLSLVVAIDQARGAAIAPRNPARARAALWSSIRLVQGPRRAMREIRTVSMGAQRGRLYDPGPEGDGRLLLYFHGGGWAVGDLRTVDHLCRRLAVQGQQRVLSVDYRLAPEHPFPAAVQDAIAAYRWSEAHADALGTTAERIAVAGDSAGGNLAAVVCLLRRDASERQPVFQLLLYPATDMRRVTASHRALEEGFLLTRHSLDWYQGHYEPEIYDPRCSPLLAEHHHDLAPAIVVSAGFDPLRDDAEAYAAALERAGNEVTELRYPRLLHGFMQMDGVSHAAHRAVYEVCGACASSWEPRTL